MWAIYDCVFGCQATHRETSRSEALAYWWSVHKDTCTEFDNYVRSVDDGKVQSR